MKELKIAKTLFPLLKLYPWAILALIVLGVLSSLSEGLGISLFIPLFNNLTQANTGNFFSELINQIFSGVPFASRPLIIALCIFLSILIKNLLTYSGAFLFAWINSQISHYLRSNVYHQLLSLNYSFLENKGAGNLINILATETWQVSRALAALVSLITTASTILVFVLLMVIISWRLTLLVAIALVLISSGIQLITPRVKKLGEQAVQANATLSQRMWEGISGMRTIRAFGQETYMQKRFEHDSKAVRNIFFKLDALSGTVSPLFEVLVAALLVCILLVAFQVGTGIPTSLTFIFLLYRLQPQVKQLDAARVSLVGLTSSAEQVMAFLDPADKPYVRSGQTPFEGLQLAIAFESVTFQYNASEQPALKEISLTIPKGKTTALVGPSGAGKSTLTGLICRFYDVTAGEIYVDGSPIRKLNLVDWRSRIAIVSQDIYIFSTTVRDNIAFGRLEATEDEIIAAAQLANAHEFICQLPQGYDTEVGDWGFRLSGGQRQRIALARAIVRDPEILILDEATNALDSIAENLIQEALGTLSQNRTVIVIAHRLSTIEQADQIIVLNEGQVVEQGNLQHLLSLNGLFAKLHRLQYSSAHAQEN